jgi:hypothetical protein
MKRFLVMTISGVALAASALAATAAGAAPAAELSAPTRVAGGSSFFVRSVTPCPRPNGQYEAIRVGVQPAGAPAGDPAGKDLGLGTQGWVNDDGTWAVTIQAPSVPVDQPTMPFTIQAECVVHTDPYYLSPSPSTNTDNEDLERLVLRYAAKQFWSTSTGGYDHSADRINSNQTTTTTAPPTTTTTAAPTTTTSSTSSTSTSSTSTTVAGFGGSGGPTPKLQSYSVDQIRAELAAQGVDVSKMSDAQILLAAPAAAHLPMHDGGLPWWSFVLATILAVGTVIAWGARKRVSDADLV